MNNMFDNSPKCSQESLESCGEQSSITGSLRRKKDRLEKELATVNEALEALLSNPELTRVIELINKAR